MIAPATGIHFGMSMEEYLAIPAVSNGVLRVLLERCAAAAWHCSPFNPKRPRDDTAASDAGSIAHEIFLEGSRECLQVIDPAEHPNLTKPFAIPDGWTNKPMREAKAAARAAGKIPVLPSDVTEIEALVCAAERFVDSLYDEEPAIWKAFQPNGGQSEVVMVWQEGDTLCKLRADRIANDHGVIIDYKSTATSVEPSAWARTMLDYMGAAWYRRGVRAVTGVNPDYVFLAGERAPPHLHSVIGVTPADRELGDEKVGEAMRRWQACERAGKWPGYPARVAYVEVPPWHYAQWMERNGSDETHVDAEIAALWKTQEEKA